MTLTGLYPFLVSSISFSVFEVTSSFSDISMDNTLLDDKILMAVSSSRMLPSDDDRTYKRGSNKTERKKTPKFKLTHHTTQMRASEISKDII